MPLFLTLRAADSGSRILIYADGYHRNGRWVDHKASADLAVETAKKEGQPIDKVLVWKRRVLSVDALKLYKPHPAVYQHAADQLNLPQESIAFVSSNFWDIAGAASFGFQTFWLNRSQLPADELGVMPTAILQSLADLAA